jgi:hypothetical protein
VWSNSLLYALPKLKKQESLSTNTKLKQQVVTASFGSDKEFGVLIQGAARFDLAGGDCWNNNAEMKNG